MKFTLEDPTTWEWARFLFYTSMFLLLQQSKTLCLGTACSKNMLKAQHDNG